jgi:hypothetical protein
VPRELGRLDGETLERPQWVLVDFGFEGEMQRRRIADQGNADARLAIAGKSAGTFQEQLNLTGKFWHKAVTNWHASA